MPGTTAQRLSLLFALLLVAAVVVAACQPRLVACGGLATGYAPILAFEFIRSLADLHALFGAAPGPCRTALLAGLGRVNAGDSWLFIPIYGGFLVASLSAARAQRPGLARAALACAVVACGADYAENACLGALAAAIEAPGPALAVLPWATGVKWLLLGVAAALGAQYVSPRPRVRAVLRGLTAVGLVVVALAALWPASFGRLASLGVALGWTALLVADVAAVVP